MSKKNNKSWFEVLREKFMSSPDVRAESPDGSGDADQFLAEQYQRIKLQLERAEDAFTARNNISRENEKFCRGEQWKDDEILAIESQGRIPYVFDQISPKINNLLGMEQSTRLDATALPVESGDEEQAAMLNKLIGWAEKLNSIEHIQSSVFQDVVIKGVGCTVSRWEMKDFVGGYPSIERVPIWQMRWDLGSVQVDGSDIKWMARMMPLRRTDAVEMYPEYEEFIMNAPSMSVLYNGINLRDLMTERQIIDAYNTSGYGFGYDAEKAYIIIIEFYEKVRKCKYIVTDLVRDSVEAFDDEVEADLYLKGLLDSYTMNSEILIDEQGNDRVYMQETGRDAIYQSVICGDRCAHRIETDLPDFPFTLCYGYFQDGTYFPPVDQLYHPQIFYNRMIAELDNQIGRSAKHLTMVVESQLATGFTYNDVVAGIARTGFVVPVRNPDAIKQLPNQPVSPDLPNAISFASSFMIEAVGGSNALGLQENAAESGVAVQRRQQAAGTARLPLFDHLRLWRKKVTEKMVWYIKNYLDEQQTIRIVGKDNLGKDTVEFIVLDDGIMDTLKEIETDISISERSDTETSRQSQFQQLMEIFKVSGETIPAELKLMTIIKFSDIDPKEKNELLSSIQFYQKYMQEMMEMQHQEKLKSQVVDSITRTQLKAEMLGQGAPNGQEKTSTPSESSSSK